jgi:hypothetical protein
LEDTSARPTASKALDEVIKLFAIHCWSPFSAENDVPCLSAGRVKGREPEQGPYRRHAYGCHG